MSNSPHPSPVTCSPMPSSGAAAPLQRQAVLPLRKAVKIAWRNIRIRWWRSLLVTSGIILALAFLTYILCSDSLLRGAARFGSESLKQALVRDGVLSAANDNEARVQTYWMAGLALLISFIGILNAMVMSVTERFREIGTMKCLGALDAFIVKLYLLESLFQGMVGTAAGMLLGIALAYIEGMSQYGNETWTLLPAAMFAKILLGCALTGLALTVASAVYPAYCAAKMEPVDAMRSEV